MMERTINKLRVRPPYPVSDSIRKIHNQLTIVDLHADPLLWNRDLLLRSKYGHVDYPRLVDGNVAIQVFGVVTKFLLGMDKKEFPLNIDAVTLFSMIDKWPRLTRKDLFQRAIFQSQKLQETIRRSNGKMRLIKSVEDLELCLAVRQEQPGAIGGLLALEGAHALNGELSNIQKLYEAAFRMIGIAHFSDNEAGGSAHGKNNQGLSPFGSELVRVLQELHMIIDLAHASRRVIDEVIEMVKTPVIASHTGVTGICNNSRNLTDDQVKKIAKVGGVIGIAMFSRAVCGKRVEDVARSVRYVADLAGVEHVGIGSDFDGAITAPVDAGGLAWLTEALLAQGFNQSEIARIMGGNALRVFREVLPRE
jgi:membrane dipeptidase